MKKRTHVDVYLSLIFIAMSGVWLYAADHIAEAGTVSAVFITSSSFPKGLAVLMIVMCVWNIADTYLRKPHEQEERSELDALLAEEEEDAAQAEIEIDPKTQRDIVRRGYFRAACLVVLAAGYVLVIKTFGYLICTAILIAGALLIFGVKSPWKIILTSVLASGTLYFVFSYILKVSLP